MDDVKVVEVMVRPATPGRAPGALLLERVAAAMAAAARAGLGLSDEELATQTGGG